MAFEVGSYQELQGLIAKIQSAPMLVSIPAEFQDMVGKPIEYAKFVVYD